jgi:hypothetical protein
VCELPVLRKDFTVSALEVADARPWAPTQAADAATSTTPSCGLLALAYALGLDVGRDPRRGLLDRAVAVGVDRRGELCTAHVPGRYLPCAWRSQMPDGVSGGRVRRPVPACHAGRRPVPAVSSASPVTSGDPEAEWPSGRRARDEVDPPR